MFEKEAEEYAVNTRTQKEIEVLNTVQDWGSESLSPEERHLWEGIRDRQVAREQGFKDGTEFGYNKANEWHYPSKGEYPKDEKDMLMSERLILLTKLKGTNNLSISIGQYNFSTQEFSYQHIVGLTEVCAWKEIVLPELPNESE